MRLLKELSNTAPNTVFLSIITGAIAGLIYGALVPIILIAMDEFSGVVDGTSEVISILGIEIAHPNLAAVFFGICIAIYVFQSVSMLVLQQAALLLASNIRKHLYNKISNAPIENLENVGTSKLLVVLMNDVNRIIVGAQSVPSFLVSFVILIGVFIYILVLNTEAFIFLVISLIFAVITYQLPLTFSMKYFNESRKQTDALQESFKSLLEGAKELKINRHKREQFMNSELLVSENKMRDTLTKTFNISILAENYGMVLTYFIIACLVFSFVNYYPIGEGELLGIVMVLLYISGPIRWILTSMAPIMRANAAYNMVDKVFDSLSKEQCVERTEKASFEAVHFKDIEFSYQASDFSVGPISLSCHKGEITFIVGGNGSGKSTFCKVATLHYYATGGGVYFDDTLVTEENIEVYRQSLSTIYSDYHLFDKLHGIDLNDEKISKELHYWLKKFKLDTKVTLNEGAFSTLSLSDGQRRRLALVVAILEDKDFYLFDEWAADQDPDFRELFYMEILPVLKQRNKLVIAITHDDRYFHAADKVVRLDMGQVSQITRYNNNADTELNQADELVAE